MWWWSLEAMAERPLRGVGTGGYAAWVRDHLESQSIDPASRRVHDHAHSTFLHVGATTGVVGLCLGAFVLCVAIRGSLAGLDPSSLGSYEAGPFFAIIGLLLAGAFDPVARLVGHAATQGHANVHLNGYLALTHRVVDKRVAKATVTDAKRDMAAFRHVVQFETPIGIAPCGGKPLIHQVVHGRHERLVD